MAAQKLGGVVTFNDPLEGNGNLASLAKWVRKMGGDEFVLPNWVAALCETNGAIEVRSQQIIVDAVRAMHKNRPDMEDTEFLICLMDEGTPGYMLLQRGQAHIEDALSPCTFKQDYKTGCTQVSTWAHVHDIDALLASLLKA